MEQSLALAITGPLAKEATELPVKTKAAEFLVAVVHSLLGRVDSERSRGVVLGRRTLRAHGLLVG